MNAAFDWAAAHAAARAPKPRQCNAFPMRLVWNEEKGKHDKYFAIPKGADWHSYKAPESEMRKAKNWGVTIPAGLVGLDLDLYEAGCSREAVEAYLGCALDWDAALLQTTASGGHHYMFVVPDGVTIKQGSKIGKVPGFDIRAAGDGLLCTGDKYTVREGLGDALTAMQTAAWPALPTVAIEKLRKVDHAPIDTTARAANDDGLPEWVRDALNYIDPDDRNTWRDVTFVLHLYDAWDIACNWSRRSPKFDADAMRKLWASCKDGKSGGVTLGTIDHLARAGGWAGPQRPAPRSARTPSPDYKLLTGTDVQALPALEWRIKGVLPARGLAQVYGPPASGKSFLAFDMAAAIAGGHDWFGYRVTQAPVIYVALEGEGGFPQRTQAWCRTHGEPLPDDMRLILQPLRINDASDVGALAKAITDAGLQDAVVIVDTQNQAAPSADENSSEDMGLILQGAKKLADLVGGVVVLVAHSGKDEGRGVRGHSSQHAAMDASIKVSRDGAAREWIVDKAKDGGDGVRHGFTLEVVRLGEDADGDAITSCVVVRDDSAKPRRKLSPGEQVALKAYVTACERGLCRGDDSFAGLHLEDWRSVFYELSTADNYQAKKKAFQRARGDICAHGHMSVDCDVYMPVDIRIRERGQEFMKLRSQYRKGKKPPGDKGDTGGHVPEMSPDQ